MDTCLDCNKLLDEAVVRISTKETGVSLCDHHRKLIRSLVQRHATPPEALQLYYGLKEAGAAPTLEWWDGSRSVDIALSRVKLNLEVDMMYEMFTCNQVLDTLEGRMYGFKNGFHTIRIPHMLIRQCLTDTIEALLGIVEGLKARSRAV
jgi:hypothetical protein